MAADPVLSGIHKALDLTVGHSEGRTNLYVEEIDLRLLLTTEYSNLSELFMAYYLSLIGT